LEQALGIARGNAEELDAKARAHEGSPGSREFVRCKLGAESRWLWLSVGEVDGVREAAVMDVEDFLSGAPPLQISRLSSSLSHELRNPLSSIKMAVQTLARNPGLSPRDQRRLVIANREVRTMERMLWLLSEYGRDSVPAFEQVPLIAMVQDAAAVVEPELAERKIELKIHCAEKDRSCRVRVDVGRLRPVLAQLFLNIAMGQPEGATIEIRVESDTHGCRLVLIDPLTALSAEERAKLFEPFGSMLARGAGLSLATLHRVMHSHKGGVTADVGTGGAGTVYTLTFPA
jgi:signal transduction histidine kinase